MVLIFQEHYPNCRLFNLQIDWPTVENGTWILERSVPFIIVLKQPCCFGSPEHINICEIRGFVAPATILNSALRLIHWSFHIHLRIWIIYFISQIQFYSNGSEIQYNTFIMQTIGSANRRTEENVHLIVGEVYLKWWSGKFLYCRRDIYM